MPNLDFANFELVRRHPVAESAHALPEVTIEHLGLGAILQVLAAPGASASEIASLLGGSPDLRMMGPGQWLLVQDKELSPADCQTLSSTLGQAAFIVDQTHGRTRIRISGPRCREILSRWTAVDLHPEVFKIGTASNTLLGHISVNLARTGTDVFEAIVLSTFAQTLWDELSH